MEPVLNHPSSSEPPDWERIWREVRCPLCDYNLRGLIESRCPECGHQFVWVELFDGYQWRHKWLFEHRMGVGSFVQTLRSSLDLSSLWERVYPRQRPRVGALMVYWYVLALPMLAMHYLLHFQQIVFVRDVSAIRVLPSLLLCAAWPWVTAISLVLLRRAVRLPRIKFSHILRCTIYSGDIGLMLGLALVPLIWWQRQSAYPPIYATRAICIYAFWAFWLAVMTYRVDYACRTYLEMRRTGVITILSQVPFVLLLVMVLSF